MGVKGRGGKGKRREKKVKDAYGGDRRNGKWKLYSIKRKNKKREFFEL